VKPLLTKLEIVLVVLVVVFVVALIVW